MAPISMISCGLYIERIAGGDDTKLFHFHEGAEVEAWLSSLADGTADFVEVSQCHGGEAVYDYERKSGDSTGGWRLRPVRTGS